MKTLNELLEEIKSEVIVENESEDTTNDDVESDAVHKSFIRPEYKVELKSLTEDNRHIPKSSIDPTSDLLTLPFGLCNGYEKLLDKLGSGYIVHDKDNFETWYAHDEACLNKNFIYRGDLDIVEVSSKEEAIAKWHEFNDSINYGEATSKVKYLLEDPMSETYEVYSKGSYVMDKYGKSLPSGMINHRYKNRFMRDVMILKLDEKYSNSSHKAAGKLVAKEFDSNEAIIVSDGAWIKNTSAYCYYYLDKETVVKQVEGCIPSDPKQAVLISEINGAYNALLKCYTKKKTRITYYYDNTNIVNVFRKAKLSMIPEIKVYKELLVQMSSEGYQVLFVELHPKRGQDRDSLNKALAYFHNECDAECTSMAEIFEKDYKSYAAFNDAKGVKADEFCYGKKKTDNYNMPKKNQSYKAKSKRYLTNY